MANTYSQLDIHIIIAVKNRAALIRTDWKERLHQYIIGIVTNKNQKMLVINSMPDHMHMLVGIRPTCTISDLMREIKASSSKWINENHLTPVHFEWQIGFGAFAVGRPEFRKVIDYILNQEERHRHKTFRKEFLDTLIEHDIDFKTEYLPEDLSIEPQSIE